jgi:23S rRNA (pseudouridine1915-N3)-methyltransferase
MRESADYYLGLIRTWLPIEESELKPLSVPDKSASTRRQIQQKEGELLAQKLSKTLTGRGAYYVLDEGGKALTTQGWAELVRSWEADGLPELAFCVGSSLGFSEEIRKKARGILSLGPQTLPHELARVVLLEQLYRAWSVTRGHPYHNEGS